MCYRRAAMEWTVTMGATLGGVALTGAAMLGARLRTRRRRRLEEVGYVPWHGLMFLGLVMALFGGVHLLTLWGRG